VTTVVDAGGPDEVWMSELQRLLPLESFVHKDQPVDPATVEFVVHWQHPTEKILSYPNLAGVVLASAGFDHVPAEIRAAVPVVRLIDPAMAVDIAHFCLSWIIHFQRNFDRFAEQQSRFEWRKLEPIFPRNFTVGVLGRGQIGTIVLDAIAEHGFAAVGWSRSNHDRSLNQFFADCDVVVNLLPNTEETQGLVSTDLLSALGNGVFINVGRGPTVDSGALLGALEGQLRAAVLDVFDTEPLPETDPLWSHPKTIITPHIAGRTDPYTAAPVVADNIRLLRAGKAPAGLVRV
jgi:glyoxylate/hydroxypyruvate reductase A